MANKKPFKYSFNCVGISQNEVCHLHKMIDEETFGDRYEKLPAAPNGFSWGYGDKEIFSRYIAEIEKRMASGTNAIYSWTPKASSAPEIATPSNEARRSM